MRILIVILIALITITKSQNNLLTDEILKEESPQLSSYIFSSNKTTCIMYTQCRVEILAKKSIEITKDHFETSSDLVFTVESIELCTDEEKSFGNLNFSTEFKNEYNCYSLEIKPVVFGAAFLKVLDKNLKKFKESDLLIIINEPRRIVDRIFDVWVWVFQVVASILMGCLLDYHTLKKIIRMPYPVLIGLSSQYILMPLLAYTFVSIFQLKPAEALALFIYGTCPGGAASNNWTILFDGDIDLSAIMTFVSTLTAFIAMPGWIYTLGKNLSDRANIKLPYLVLFANIFITVGPCLLGFILAHFVPKIKAWAQKIAKPVVFFLMLTFLTLILTTKYYVFYAFRWYHLIAGPLIPWSGYITGGLFATIFCLPLKQIKTVSIETGLQNVGIAFLVIMTNFPSPDKEIAFLPMIAVSFLTIIPLYFAYGCLKLIEAIRFLINKLKKNENGSSQQIPPEQKKMIDEPEA